MMTKNLIPKNKRKGIPSSVEGMLSFLPLIYYGFDGKAHQGEIIVNRSVAEEVVEIFQTLFNARYPIAKMQLMSVYDDNDTLAMADNNSSGFCYRTIAGTTTLSMHAKGLAIDINPCYNPYIYKADGETKIEPEAAKKYLDRSQSIPGMILPGDVCYEAFTSRGWVWGGSWKDPIDYHHFQKKL